MQQAKFSVKEAQANFLSNFKSYGFKDKSSLVRTAIDHRHRLVKIRGKLSHSKIQEINQALLIVFELKL